MASNVRAMASNLLSNCCSCLLNTKHSSPARTWSCGEYWPGCRTWFRTASTLWSKRVGHAMSLPKNGALPVIAKCSVLARRSSRSWREMAGTEAPDPPAAKTSAFEGNAIRSNKLQQKDCARILRTTVLGNYALFFLVRCLVGACRSKKHLP